MPKNVPFHFPLFALLVTRLGLCRWCCFLRVCAGGRLGKLSWEAIKVAYPLSLVCASAAPVSIGNGGDLLYY